MKGGWLVQTALNKVIISFGVAGVLVSLTSLQQQGTVIQIDIKSLLNGRAVTIMKEGKLIPWNKGVDRENGYLTASASVFNKETGLRALPDNALINANTRHPEIMLHYSNDNTKDNQVFCIADSGEFSIPVPKKHYKSLYLSMTSAYGPSLLQIEMIYENGSESKIVTLPDWYNDLPPENAEICYVVHNLGKWAQKNGLTEKDHHNIDAVILYPDVKSVLKSIKVIKGKAGYLLFWAATGVME